MTAAAAGRPSREYRATAALLVTGVFTLVVVLIYRNTISSVPAIGLVTLAGPVIGAVVELVIALGLGWRLAWAAAAMSPALWVVALGGVLTFLVSLTAGTLEIPIGAILVIWALRAPPQAMPDPDTAPPRSAGRVLAPILVAALVVVAAWPLIVPTATRPGGPLIAASTDLDLELQTAAACPGGAGPAHDPPETIDVVLRWTWAREEPIRSGTDAIVFSWATMSGEEMAGYYLDEPIEQQPGITEEDRSSLFAIYRNDLGANGFEPGSVTIRLHRPNELGSGAGLVQVAATYAHHYTGQVGLKPSGLWTRVEEMSCEW
jgi:hypothetical protein